MDQEKRIAYLVKNDWSTAPVPTEYRRSNYGVVATLVGQIIALSGIYIGAGMVGGLTLTQAFIATVIGSIILAVLGGFELGRHEDRRWPVHAAERVFWYDWLLHRIVNAAAGSCGLLWLPSHLLRRNNSRHVSGRWLDHKPDRCRRLGRYSDDDYRFDRL